MPLLKTSVIVNPCVECPACKRTTTADKALHLGNFYTDNAGNPHPDASNFPQRPEWNINGTWSTNTYLGHKVEIRVATTEDVDTLVSTPEVFPVQPEGTPNLIPQIVAEFTDRRALYYPYICIAIAERKIVSRLFLDPNPENAVRRDLTPAIIDNLVTSSAFAGRGYADKLLEFAEKTARVNKVRWLEIGCTREANPIPDNPRNGTDSLRLYLRRGYHNYPTILHNGIQIHYQARNLPDNAATMDATRYGKALIVYKDLDNGFVFGDEDRKQIHSELIAELPN